MNVFQSVRRKVVTAWKQPDPEAPSPNHTSPSPGPTEPYASRVDPPTSAENVATVDFRGRCQELLLRATEDNSFKASIMKLKGEDAQRMVDFLEIVCELINITIRTWCSFN